jgi:hypothetical protein
MNSMSGFLIYHTFRVRSVLQGHNVTILIDGGASHNFIDSNMVERRGILIEEFDGFTVFIPGGHKMSCTKWIPNLEITMGNYSMTEDFFVVDIPDTNVVLGVQWIYFNGRCTTGQRTMEMKFTRPDGKKVVLWAMHRYPPKIVSSHNMEAVMRHDDIEWVVECFISNREPPDRLKQLAKDLHVLLYKHHKVFSDIPPGIQPGRGFEHIIELEEGVQEFITNPYQHPKVYKDDIEKTIKELLKLDHIHPTSSPFASSIVLVNNKDGTMWMCIDYRALKKKTIKNRHPTPKIYELMDELRGAKLFSKIDLRSRYHQIKV